DSGVLGGLRFPATLWQNGNSIFSDPSVVQVFSLNNLGQAVGYGVINGAGFGFFLNNGVKTLFNGTLVSLNNRSQAVGSSSSGSPALWDPIIGFRDINSLGLQPGWQCVGPVIAINDSGQILSAAIRPDGRQTWAIFSPYQSSTATGSNVLVQSGGT